MPRSLFPALHGLVRRQGLAEQPAPSYSLLRVIAGFPVQVVGYPPVQLTPSIAEIKVVVTLPPGTQAPPPGVPPAYVVIASPYGVRFVTCPAPGCRVAVRGRGEIWTRSLGFRPGPQAGSASSEFLVRARGFGVTADGVNAAAALPEVRYSGPGDPVLVSSFVIPSGSSYDWSPDPQAAASRAGGALLAAVQEVLHAADPDPPQTGQRAAGH